MEPKLCKRCKNQPAKPWSGRGRIPWYCAICAPIVDREKKNASARANYASTRKKPTPACKRCNVKPARSAKALYCADCRIIVTRQDQRKHDREIKRKKPGYQGRKNAYERERYASDPELARAKIRTKRRNNIELYRATNRAYRRQPEQRAKAIAYNREYRRTNENLRKKIRAWEKEQRSSNPDYAIKHKVRNRERELGLRNALATLSAEQAAMIGQLIIEAKASKLQVDHIVPLAGCKICGLKGGWEPENLQLLSAEENLEKHNRCQKCWEAAGA